MADVFNGLGVEVASLDREDFLKVKETLTRMGLIMPPNTIYQTCFVLHKRGGYAIMHHLEMKMLDGQDVAMDEADVGHRNTVAHLLNQWGLIEVLDPESILSPRAQPGGVIVVPYKDKGNYVQKPFYNIGQPNR